MMPFHWNQSLTSLAKKSLSVKKIKEMCKLLLIFIEMPVTFYWFNARHKDTG